MKQWLIAVDQLINATWPFSGWADETVSARAYRRHTKRRRWYYGMRLIDAFFRLFFRQRHHCRDAYVSEFHRRHLPPEYRDEMEESLRD